MRALPNVLAALALLALACGPSPTPHQVEAEPAEVPGVYPAIAEVPVALTVEPERAELAGPNRCDKLVVVRRPGRPARLGKQLPDWWRSARSRADHQAWSRAVIRVVANELGVGPHATELLWRKALSESSGNETAVHVLNPDLEAARAGASVGRRSSSPRWRRATVPIYEERRGEFEVIDEHDAWQLGRGLYGQVTGYYLPRWSAAAPPWELCDPVVATVTLIWSARSGQGRCRSSSLRDSYRWISAGKCEPRSEKRERAWDRMARGHVRGLKLPRMPAAAPADWGNRWSEQSADRALLLAKLRHRIAVDVGPAPR